jgi:putative hydrolase of HD superfamily
MALIHDLPETRTGDLNYVQRQYNAPDATEALSDSLADTSIEQEVLELWLEYRSRETVEAKIVKDADNLDCDLELQEAKALGSSLSEVLQETRERVFEQLHTQSAKRLFSRIRQGNCHDWHTKGRNRLNSGDWRRAEAGE